MPLAIHMVERLVFTALSLGLLYSSLAAQENFYAVTAEGGAAQILYLDPITAEIQDVKLLPSNRTTLFGLTHDGSRLWSIYQQGFFPDSLVQIHPASGYDVIVGTTGFDWDPLALAYNPNSSVLYAAYVRSLYVIDRTTGTASLKIATIAGIADNDCICSMAFHPSGQAYGLGFLSHGQNLLYKLDLQSGRATLVGSVAVAAGTGTGVFRDMAFDSSGKLWAVWLSFATQPNSGLYTIDLNSLQKTLVQPFQSGVFQGIAFGPATAEAGFCVAKQGLTGCTPSIGGSGIASPTARSGYTVNATGVRNNKLGMLMLSTAGRNAAPFNGGTLCVHPPLMRTMPSNSGGSLPPTDDCSGSWSIDVNGVMTHAKGFLTGTVVTAQWFGRDGPAGLALSDGWEFTLLP